MTTPAPQTPPGASRGPNDPTSRVRTEPRSRGWVVGRVAGAPVVITPSWVLAAVVLTLVFAPTVRRLAPAVEGGGVVVVAFAFVLLLFGSVFLHEVAHALVARARGHRVTELAVTLWGGHTAYTGTTRRPVDGALVAVVGPLTNVVLAVVFWVLFQLSPVASVPALLLYAAAFSNAFVGLFNLLPGLPLDGGQILESLVWAVTGSRVKGTVAAGWAGRVVALGVLAWALVWPFVAGVRPDWVTVMWSALLAAFLWSGAGEAVAAGRRREAVAGLTARGLGTRAVVVGSGASVADAARAVAGVPDAAVVVVTPAGEPVGWVDPAAASAVPPAAAATTPVDAVVVPFPAGSAVDADLAGADLLQHVAATSAGARVVPVLEHGRVGGVLDVAHVARAVRRR
ncbi:site-2 protease family protein [Puerhibacterium sp. TATVAM-FAB25]|uniref:site-2 protease family protein n=1 Tax=Puerhibacterium sp. TATVAM-FAB25 TaxID=3093699 RepID=UPI00397CF959